MNYQNHSVNHRRQDHRVGNVYHRRRVDQDVIVTPGQFFEQIFHSSRANQFSRVRRDGPARQQRQIRDLQLVYQRVDPDVACQIRRQPVHRLDAQGVHLHFDVGHDDKVRIQLVDDQGNVVRQIPQDKALQLLAGGTGGLAVDMLG